MTAFSRRMDQIPEEVVVGTVGSQDSDPTDHLNDILASGDRRSQSKPHTLQHVCDEDARRHLH